MSGDATGHQEDAPPSGEPAGNPGGSIPARPFVWPPKPTALPPGDPGGREPSHAAGARPRRPRVSHLAEAITSIERAWLGLTCPPWRILAAEAHWQPDDPASYCFRCGRSVGPFETTPPESHSPGCSTCRDSPVPWDRFVRLGEYAGVLRRAVLEVKFHRSEHLGTALGHELGVALDTQLAWARVDRSRVRIIPVPASHAHRVRTGIDHAMILAAAVRDVAGGRIVRPIRRRHGPSQREVPRGERQRNARRSFTPTWNIRQWLADLLCWGRGGRTGHHRAARRTAVQLEPGTTLVLVDDVKTTGATLSAACRAVLASYGLKRDSRGRKKVFVWCCVASVTPEPGRASPSGPRGSEALVGE